MNTPQQAVKRAIIHVPNDAAEGCGCAAIILAIGITVFLFFAALQLTDIVQYLTQK